MPKSAKDKAYDRAIEAVRAWANSVDISELRRGAADRLATSYGISAVHAMEIIVATYRRRNGDGQSR